MKYLCEVLLFCFFVTVLSNSTKVSSKTARTDNDTKHHPHCGVNNNYFYAGPNSKKIENMFSNIQQQLTKLEQEIRNMKNQTCEKQDGKAVYKNCAEVYKSGDKISGVYKIDPDGLGEFEVFCDQTTAGGGWTVFQKRYNGAVDFFRGWNDYKQGFGNLNSEFWLGLNKIHRLTARSSDKLRVDLEDFHGKTAFAEYSSFSVASERAKYLLGLGVYSGTAGDSLSHHRGSPFTTKDRDNDAYSGNCASTYTGAWWYKKCHYSNLNGLYMNNKNDGKGMAWYHWKKNYKSVKRSEMKIRPKDF
nr:microfibril-associated glycoprotein 4-like [Pocillopora verrucosa]